MSKRGARIAKLQENYIKKGRGAGTGADYQPFIQAHDNKIASEGWITRHKGWKTGRIHHTLSFPLERTIEIAKKLGIQHPHVDGTAVVMTTDFRLSLSTPKVKKDAIRTIKPISSVSFF
ncbi:TnsA endonuclease N-terminal domain-containing protein [Paenibacillus sp. sptzw28]|uniref:TnsA endonuclease N-terminal domain-containing protein n=1 Tax=Paenibacillus sp. sptzw28 TaxID=715179 RepID=UPI00216315FE|nr:TnsA endonuclease N-terminal domain-containing protein [Paenibacillus sp. sptzw28]